MTTESHPLQPFLPEGATHLFLGSFPPPRSKWSMDFFYPNFINDFWRMPSTSRAYPLALAKKAACYSRLFATECNS